MKSFLKTATLRFLQTAWGLRLVGLIEKCLPLAEKFYLRRLQRIQARKFATPREQIDSKNILIYCPNVGGHRPVYSARVIEYYKSQGYEVYFVYAGILMNQRKRQYAVWTSPFTERFKDDANVHLVCFRDEYQKRFDELEFIVEQQRKYNASMTLFIDGDTLMSTFWEQTRKGRPRLVGRNYAVIILIDFIYRGMKLNELIRQPVKMEQLPHFFFHKYQLKHVDLIDGALCCDENLVDKMKSPRHFYLGDLTHFSKPKDLNQAKNSFFAGRIKELQEFLARNPGREVILQFGELEPRKGYDFLLRLVAENPDLVLVRAGRTKTDYKVEWDAILNKEKLLVEGRLYETDIFIDSQEFIDALFGSIRYFIFAYKDHFRTSIMMAQALSYGKPVLVPNIGLMNARVKRYKVGRVYKHKDYKSLVEEWTKLRTEVETYSHNIEKCNKDEFADQVFSRRLGKITGCLEPVQPGKAERNTEGNPVKRVEKVLNPVT